MFGKKFGVVFLLGLFLFGSVAFVSAGFFGDLWGTITGHSIVESDLVLYYEFNSGLGDSSGNGNNGVNNSGRVLYDYDYGRASYYGVFDDGVYVSIEDVDDDLDMGSSDLTIAMWIKRSDVSNSIERLYSKRDGMVRWYDILLEDDNRVRSNIAFNYSASGAANIRSSVLIDDTEWHHVAVVFDREGGGQIYVDGVASGAAVDISGQAGDLSTDVSAIVGGYEATPGNVIHLFDGSMDDVKIWKKALSAVEIMTEYGLFSAGIGTNCVDSDGGRNLFVKGVIEGSLLTTGEKPTDYCVTYEEKMLVEYFCKEVGEGHDSWSYECDDGCFDGACTSSDTVCDSGWNCYNNGSRAYVSSNCTWSQAEECPGCVDGECLGGMGVSCVDSDGGLNYHVKGQITSGTFLNGSIIGPDSEIFDVCGKDVSSLFAGDENALFEYYCDDGGIIRLTENADAYDCPDGCSDGACLGEGCVPSYTNCSVEPPICPSTSEQVRTCSDVSECGVSDEVTPIACYPGDCGACELGAMCLQFGDRKTIDEVGSYCDYSGEFVVQKNDSLACDNSYECSSNLCSDGACVSISELVEFSGSFKGLGVRVMCRLGSIFGLSDYDECVVGYLGDDYTRLEGSSVEGA